MGSGRALDAWWCEPLSGEESRVSPDGLSAPEAAERLRRFGPNTFVSRPQRPVWLQFLSRFRNPLVLILLAASAVAAYTHEVASFAIIVVIVLMSVTLDFVQEFRAGKAVEALRQSVAVRATVLRGGVRHEMHVDAIVPGDQVLLSAGDLVPADGRILEARDLFVQQALLTGEPYPVGKHASTMPASTDLSAAINAVFMGTSVLSGSARVLVMRTGASTALGTIASSISKEPPPTAFELGTRRFGLLILRLTLLLTLFVMLVNAWLGKPWPESFLFAVALAVGLTPELLPMIVSVTLAHGAIRMSKWRVVVRRLSAIEDLGTMDVLCTDKTGTLTEAKIKLEQHLDASGRESNRVLELAYLNSFHETGLKSPLDEAILEHGHIDVTRWRKIDEVPFDFERRRVSVLLDDGQQRLLVVKGAPEDVLRLCATCEEGDPGRQRALSEVADRVQRIQNELGDEGFRTLGIAWKALPRHHEHATVTDESALVFCGFAGFLDPPKASAGAAMAALAESGVTVKIVTGDNERVTQHICRTLGLPVLGVLTGAQLAQMDDHALEAVAEQVNLFCRVTPTQKNQIILALKRRGHVVGYLGDGVNDAPPLHSADVGLSVDTAVDVAREAADIILLERDLGVLREGVLEGRRTFANIMKYIMMATSSNFGNMFSMAAASVFLPFLPMLPAQILLNNMLYDLSEIPIPTDRVDESEIAQPRRWDIGFIRDFMWVLGPVSSLFDLLTFWILLVVLHAGETLFHTGWFVESLATQVLVIFIIRTRGSPLASRPARALALAAIAVATVAAVLPFTPLAGYLGFVAPPPAFYAILVGLVGAYLGLAQLVKTWFYRHHPAA